MLKVKLDYMIQSEFERDFLRDIPLNNKLIHPTNKWRSVEELLAFIFPTVPVGLLSEEKLCKVVRRLQQDKSVVQQVERSVVLLFSPNLVQFMP